MANVNIKFNNKDYLLSCDDGQEEDLKKLTKFLDKKYTDLKGKLGNLGENKLLLITTIQVIDEYFDLKRKVMSQKSSFEKLNTFFVSGEKERGFSSASWLNNIENTSRCKKIVWKRIFTSKFGTTFCYAQTNLFSLEVLL